MSNHNDIKDDKGGQNNWINLYKSHRDLQIKINLFSDKIRDK